MVCQSCVFPVKCTHLAGSLICCVKLLFVCVEYVDVMHHRPKVVSWCALTLLGHA